MTDLDVLRILRGEIAVRIGSAEDRIARLEAAQATRAVPAIRQDMAHWQRQVEALTAAIEVWHARAA